jgi:hypothetical protein
MQNEFDLRNRKQQKVGKMILLILAKIIQINVMNTNVTIYPKAKDNIEKKVSKKVKYEITHSFVTIQNHTRVHRTFVTGHDLRYKLLICHKIMNHPV